MPRLIPPELGNGKRPSDPAFSSSSVETAVPVLDVSEDTHELVGAVHDAALDPGDDTQLLTGAVAMLDNPRPVGAPDTPSHTVFVIGGSTLHEAATEVVGALGNHALDMPEWVACADPDLGAVLAEHYTVKGYSTCRLIDMSEVPS
jgi:hypothetical protein